MTFFRFDVRNYKYDKVTKQTYDISSKEELAKFTDVVATIKYPNSNFENEKYKTIHYSYKEEIISLNLKQSYSHKQYMRRLSIKKSSEKTQERQNEYLKAEHLSPEFSPNEVDTKDCHNYLVKFFLLSKKEEVSERENFQNDLSSFFTELIRTLLSNCGLLGLLYSCFLFTYKYIIVLLPERNNETELTKICTKETKSDGTNIWTDGRSLIEALSDLIRSVLSCLRLESLELQEHKKALNKL